MLLRWYCSVVVLTLVGADVNYIHKPHIVFIVADDLGWDDVSCHGSDQILTPNMDALAYHGVELYQYYTDCDGTPSRSAMFTGKYPLRMGTQGPSIRVAEDRGIPVRERLLPNYLQELGYVTHLVGKWGVGKSRPHYHPSNRGFGDFCGFLGDAVDFFTYNAIEKCDSKTFYGLDFFHNFDAIENQSGHLTHVLTTKAVQVIRNHNTSVPLYLHLAHAATHTGGAMAELQPPADSISENDHIAHPLRRLHAGSVTALDKSIGHVVAALAEREILHNTLIVIVSDNGAPTVGPTQNFGSNFPFRGVKTTPWEGGVRSIGIVWHHQISPKIFEGLVHVTDWVPTLVTAAGGKVTEPIDGIDQWCNIHEGTMKNKRSEILLSLDESKGWAAYREGDYKIIVGDVEREFSSHFGKDLKQLKGTSPNYENALLECETVHVFKETLNLPTDLDAAHIKREEFNLQHFVVEEPGTHICVPTRGKGCLFNISADPLENQDLWHSSPDIVRHLTLRLRSYWAELRPRGLPYCDQRADPALRNYTWSPWITNDELKLEPFLMVPPFPLQVSIGEIQFLVDLNFNTFKSKVDSYIKSMGEAIVKSISGLFSV